MGKRSESMWDEVEDRLRRATAGRYEIEKRIGVGGMGAVFRAVDRLSRPVAVKVLAPQLLASPEFEERFLREAKTVARLRHPNLIYIHDFDRADGLHYFVMSYVGGPSLSELCASHGPLPVDVVRVWLYQMADALAYAHKQNVVHRDVKPSNVLIDADGRAILTDFGIAQEEEQDDLTRTGMIVGSPPYLSPERWDGERAGPASDQYSLGIVAYEMLAGKPPFSGTTLAMMDAHANRPPPPLPLLRPDCPPELVILLERMLGKKIEDRWPSLREVADQIGLDDAESSAEARRALAVRVPEVPVVGSVTVVARAQTIEQGQSLTLAADILDEDGEPLSESAPAWESSDPAVASVTDDGVVLAHQPGFVDITVLFEGHADKVSLRVAPKPVASVTVSSPTAILVVGDTAQMQALAVDAEGAACDANLLWSSTNPTVVSVADSGVVTANATGSATIEARADGITGSATLRVVATPVAAVRLHPSEMNLRVGRSAKFDAEVVRHDGNTSDHPVEWTSDDPSVVEVDGRGQVTAHGPGAASIHATCEGQTATALVAVQLVPVDTLELSVTYIAVRVGEELKIGATPRSASGAELKDRTVVWRPTNPDVLAAGRDGEFVATAAGRSEVIVSCEGVIARVGVDVEAPTGTDHLVSPTKGLGIQPPATLNDGTKDERTYIGPLPTHATGTREGPVVAPTPPAYKKWWPALGVLPVAALVWWISGLGGGVPVPPPIVTTQLSILTPDSVAVGDSVRLAGVAVESTGDTVPLSDASWVPADPAILTVRGRYAIALAAGQTTVRLQAFGESAESLITAHTPDESVVPTVGQIVVQARTSGNGAYPNRLTVAVGNRAPQNIGVNDRVVFESVPVGSNTVRLVGVGGPCTLRGSARQAVPVNPGQSVTVRYDISCVAEETVTTPPVQPPPARSGRLRILLLGGYAFLSVDGVNRGRGTTFDEEVPAGSRTVRLSREAIGLDTTFVVNVPGGGVQTVEVNVRR